MPPRKRVRASEDAGGDDVPAAKPQPFRIDAKRLREGDMLSRRSVLCVVKKSARPGMVDVRNLKGKTWTIDEHILEEECVSPHQFGETRSVARKYIAIPLHDAEDNIFKARFIKNNGEECVLVGQMKEKDTLMGRALVIDLEKNNFAQVDYRTLSELVLCGVHYVLNTYKGEQFENGVHKPRVHKIN